MDVMKRVPVAEQEAKVRATNFEEVCLGYNEEEAMPITGRTINITNLKQKENQHDQENHPSNHPDGQHKRDVPGSAVSGQQSAAP